MYSRSAGVWLIDELPGNIVEAFKIPKGALQALGPFCMYNRNGARLMGKEVSVTTAAKKKKKENRVARYFNQTRAELRKVTWPSREEAIRLTAIVLGVTVAMAAFLGLLDYLFSQAFGLFI